MQQLRGKSVKPGLRGLFQAIQRLMQPVDMVRELMIHIAKGLGHVDFLLQKTMEKGIGDIQLPERPMKTHCSWFHNRTECLSIVHTNLLMKALCN